MAGPSRPWMIYGAYGFTGRLVAEEAVRRGHRPVLAGRDSARLGQVAERHGLRAIAFSLEDGERARVHLSGMACVLNAAGPFAETGPALIGACLDTATHYADLSGEFHHLRWVEALDEKAKRAGIVLLTGAGFGVTYGDCLARRAVDLLPDATHLRLSVAAANAQTTPAVRRTVMEVLARGGYAVEAGQIERRALAHETWRIGALPFAAAPLGELAALRRTTGVANIVVGRPIPARAARIVRALSPLIQGALGLGAIRRLLSRDRPAPPLPAPAGGWRSSLWAQAHNARGDRVALRLDTGEGYAATAEAALANIEALLTRDAIAGAMTPGLAFGAGLLPALAHVTIAEI